MTDNDVAAADVLSGVVAGPNRGLRFQTPTLTGLTDDQGRFRYRTGESVTFLVGGLVLGGTKGAPRVNLAQLVDRSDGKVERLHDPMVTNLARFVQTLDADGDYEDGIIIVPAVHDVIGQIVLNFNQASTDATEVEEEAGDKGPGTAAMVAFSTDQTITFATDAAVTGLLEKLNATPGVFTANTPRRLRDGAAARNELRRNIRGIRKLTDVRIPTRDGSYVCADVFLPDDEQQHPVVMNQGFYGKSFDHGIIAGPDDARKKE
ncbi:MAG: hydrolase, partial [Actinomycetota bacterium]|nr:hydrolase [Actinomycetota bacterium]